MYYLIVTFIWKISLFNQKLTSFFPVKCSKLLQVSSLASKLLMCGVNDVMAAKQACYEIYYQSEKQEEIKTVSEQHNQNVC